MTPSIFAEGSGRKELASDGSLQKPSEEKPAPSKTKSVAPRQPEEVT
jgi:hypothetical protein